MLPVLIVRLDQLIAAQLDLVLHHPRLQQLEGAWRGLHLLAVNTAGTDRARVKLLDIRFDEIHHDLERALEPDHSQLFNKIHSNEFDHAGGEPFGLLVGDYVIDHRQSSQLNTLRAFSQIAATAFAPFVCAASPAIFGIKHFVDMNVAAGCRILFQHASYRALLQLKQHEDSRFLALVLPRIRLRQCWGEIPSCSTLNSSILNYRERCRDSNDYLWGNAAFALAAVIMREFCRDGWFTQTRGAPRNEATGGIVDQLDLYAPAHDDTAFAPLPITEVVITDHSTRALAAAGFIGLSQCWNTRLGVFLNLPSLHDTTQLQHVLCASRIAHHLKSMMRDRVGSLASAADCESLIDDWLRQYTTAAQGADFVTQARYPLSAARVTVEEDTSAPGHYHCTLRLHLHHQPDEIESEIRLTTELIHQVA